MKQPSQELKQELSEIPAEELRIALMLMLDFPLYGLQIRAQIDTELKSDFIRALANGNAELLTPEDVELELGNEYPELYDILRKVTDGDNGDDSPF